jgi:ABC-2 type transport system ATP-binding protein
VMHAGRLIAAGPIEAVRGGRSLEDAFVRLVGADQYAVGQLDWLGSPPA